MTEQNNNCTEKSITDIELEVMRKIKDEMRLNWYDRVYLCYENINFKPPTTYGPIKGFNCYQYDSFKNADIELEKKPNIHKLGIRHTMIPMCRWVPEIFDKYILNWKLRNIYWGGQICTGCNQKEK